jgi:galactose mutarotase-like enzyme
VKEIRYSKHLQTKLTLRTIPGELATDIYRDADERFSDKQTGYMVAVKQVEIYGHQREVMIAYEEDDETVVIITVHPLKKGQKENRIATGRWVKL